VSTVIDQANTEFWNELCGSGLARHLGITDHSLESLRRFDEAFFAMYPYLLPLLGLQRMAGKRVLEIGLGYGSVGQKIAEAQADYTGLDLAANPVRMMTRRLRLLGLPGTATAGTALDLPFPDEHFDFVVSIGCFHHTGNVQRCLDESHRVLRPGGTAVLMLYNKFSLRQWLRAPLWALRELGREVLGRPAPSGPPSARQLMGYDHNAAGDAAPETVLLSIHQLRRMLRAFECLTFAKQNCDPLFCRGRVLVNREKLLPTLGRTLGLDIYVEARKHDNHGRRMPA
jgi:SAM-dependent methyltransferase